MNSASVFSPDNNLVSINDIIDDRYDIVKNIHINGDNIDAAEACENISINSNSNINVIQNKLKAISAILLKKDDTDHYIDNVNWIGFVEKIKNNIIYGRMKEIEKDTTEETVEFELDEVSDDDLPLLKVGSIFYYSIGHAYINGQKRKQENLRFKRGIDFTENDVDEIHDKAKELANSIIWK